MHVCSHDFGPLANVIAVMYQQYSMLFIVIPSVICGVLLNQKKDM